MKKFYYTSIVIFISILLYSCSELDTNPKGGNITEDQKGDVISKDPSKLQAEINALSANLITFDIAQANNHDDFGYAAACMTWDAASADNVASDVGYNWFSQPLTYKDRDYQGRHTAFIWRLFYRHISYANGILKIIPEEYTDVKFSHYKGQALAARAFAYLQLIQTYQFTYLTHKDALGVPIVTEETSISQAANNPRAKVEDVYNLILSDLTQAIELLDGFKRSGKDAIDLNVAYGLRARTNLLMGKWDDAAKDADKAMEGYSPYTLEEVSKPTFNSASANSWIWANIITEDNDVVKTGIINWPSHLCSLNGSGYAVQTGTWRRISKLLWDKIPATDVRKGWWVDQDLKSPLIDELSFEDKKGKAYNAGEWFGWDPYTNVKFAPYNDLIENTVNASDWPLMRTEEMILIKAEALAMKNPAEGKNVLEQFVQTYRDPEYKLTDLGNIIDEIHTQRRIELWSEGFSFFDMQRLGKDLIRYNTSTGDTNFEETSKFNISKGSDILLWRIPANEINTNSGIPESANNPSANPPTPGK